jgi:hypothetical protein
MDFTNFSTEELELMNGFIGFNSKADFNPISAGPKRRPINRSESYSREVKLIQMLVEIGYLERLEAGNWTRMKLLKPAIEVFYAGGFVNHKEHQIQARREREGLTAAAIIAPKIAKGALIISGLGILLTLGLHFYPMLISLV